MSNPFRHDPHPDLTAAIRGVVNESHTRAQLEKLSITRLRELKKKYEALVLKGNKDAARELADIRGLLRSKGAGVMVDESRTRAQPEGAKQLDEVVIPVSAIMLLPVWIKQAILVALVGGTALSYVLDQLHGLKLAMLDKETREQTLAVHEWAKRKAERDGIKAAKAALLKGHKPSKGKKPQSKGKKPQSKGTKPVSEGTSPCEKAALKRLRDAEAADLKEYPGKRGEAAHKRLHKTIGKVVGEGTVHEMAQTAQRSKEMNKKVDAAYIKKDRALEKAFAAGHGEGSKRIRKIDSDYLKLDNQNAREKSSKKLYGKGGKEIDPKRYKGKTVGAEGNLRKPKGNAETKLRDAYHAERLRGWGVYSND